MMELKISALLILTFLLSDSVIMPRFGAC